MTGKVRMSRKKIMMHIGDLFILRININLQGSVMDSPELMWAEPHLEPVYQAARSYLEINQRVSLLNQRLDVISDLVRIYLTPNLLCLAPHDGNQDIHTMILSEFC